MGRHLSPWNGQVILVSGYPVLTAVNWSQHWRPICVHYQFSCVLKLARKYEIEHWSRSSKTINWSVDSFQKNTSRRWVDTWARDMVMWYWTVATLFWQLPIDHFVNVQYTRCGLAKTPLIHPSIPFDSFPYPTLAVCRRVMKCQANFTGNHTDRSHFWGLVHNKIQEFRHSNRRFIKGCIMLYFVGIFSSSKLVKPRIIPLKVRLAVALKGEAKWQVFVRDCEHWILLLYSILILYWAYTCNSVIKSRKRIKGFV